MQLKIMKQKYMLSLVKATNCRRLTYDQQKELQISTIAHGCEVLLSFFFNLGMTDQLQPTCFVKEECGHFAHFYDLVNSVVWAAASVHALAWQMSGTNLVLARASAPAQSKITQMKAIASY